MSDHNTEPVQTKVCSRLEKCLHPNGPTLPLTEFYREKRTKSGLRVDCKACVAERAKKWRESHRDEQRDYLRKWQQDNRDKVHTYARKYRENNPERERERGKQKRLQNPELTKERQQRWKQENPEKVRQSTQRRNALRRELAASLTIEQWGWLLEQSGYCCVYCGQHESETGKLVQEHIIPVIQRGAYTVTNIVPSCQKCNLRKAGKTPEQAGMEMIIKINPLEHMKQKGLFDDW